ncbi:MAG TPA: hypothetical protein VMS55_03690, partial [Myxococcota bacterium]|nr:hypothetical protein [Myxococcota bacterium]
MRNAWARLRAASAVVSAFVLLPLVAGATAPPSTGSCNLGNGITHVIHITFDNVHFFRDNPNVPSDLELMPHLLQFLEQNGTLLSNMHTGLIAHTAQDSLSIYTGLYGDRHGMPVSNSYKTYHPDGTTEANGSFVYWTSPVYNSATRTASAFDASPSMVYSATVPAANNAPSKVTPAPWVVFTRAGCSVGDFSTANMVLENVGLDIPTVFGAGSAEAQQLAADPSSFKDPETADYVGVAIHCATGDAVCASAQAVKFGQSTATPSAVADRLSDEPGGYDGFQALFGHRYVAPQLGAGTASLQHNGYAVTNAAGNLVALDGHEIRNSFANQPGFPGFNPLANESLAYLADMQEAGIPVTYGYISDLHERKPGTSGCTTAGAGSGFALGPGDACYVANAKAYDDAFATFFQRLAAAGITPANTLFVINAEENDHFAGGTPNRAPASAPTPAGCNGVVPCSYAAGQIGELSANLPGLVATQFANTTPFDVEPQGASIYVRGQPGPTDPAVRQLERDVAHVTADNPYNGTTGESIVNYQAGQLEQRILHLETADPLRTPTFSVFPKGDYFFSQGPPNCVAPCVSIFSRFAWDHGYYSPNIDITWTGMVGPNVSPRGLDGPDPLHGAAVLDPTGNSTVPAFSNTGTWADETDIRPTMLSLLGLKDDYQTDGRVITEILDEVPLALHGTESLAACYKQLNGGVGEFATNTLLAESAA